ncbi:MAG: hypothetical protein AAB919_03060 [Patescibacteria group bacterium]
METKPTFRENALRVVAILGLLAILLLGAWGIIQLAFFISSLFNNAGGAASNVVQTPVQETLTVSLPASAAAGSSVAINWSHQGGSGAYSYALSYSCVSGLSFKAPVPTGALQPVACDTPFNYTQATENMTLTPVYSGTSDAKTTITVKATKLSTGAVTASATGNLTVPATKKAPAKTTTKAASPKTTYVASGRTTNLYGYSDLAVSISSAYSRGGNVTVQFVVNNIGTNVSPANWSFDAVLPINGSYTYPSGPQRALYPGDKIAYTLNFSDYNYNSGLPAQAGYTYGTCNQYGPCAVPGYSGGCGNYPCGYTPPYTNWTSYQPCANCGYGGNYDYNYGYNQNKTVTITVDPYNQIYELSEYNNTATASYISY